MSRASKILVPLVGIAILAGCGATYTTPSPPSAPSLGSVQDDNGNWVNCNQFYNWDQQWGFSPDPSAGIPPMTCDQRAEEANVAGASGLGGS